MKRNRTLAAVLGVSVSALVLAGCGSSEEPTTTDTGSTEGGDEISVGFSLKTQEAPFFVAIGEGIKRYGEEKGWEVTVLDANNDVQKEAANLETFTSQGMDAIFIDPIEPDAALPSIALADAEGIPVIAVDNAAAEGAKIITNVYANNPENARLVGMAYAEANTDAIKGIMISGSKVDLGSLQRRTGLIAGIIEYRLGLSVEDSWAKAEDLEQELKDTGSTSYPDASLEIVAQGFGDWSEDGGLQATEDLITAHPDITTVFGENDDMLFGAMTALANAQMDDVDIVAAADGAQRALDLIAEGKYFATGLNSPDLIAETAVNIAAEILSGEKTADDFPFVTLTEPAAITKDNVAEFAGRGF
ncbi:monosaccharide ABC transporter substrate-binding protein, CUT2 family [Ruaniaceae bacterium KH17]|nr:monosaccharide ABC transporter substrate-binding protein, CUT2 family [Ruaniaceae bacterium KH17]